MAHNDLDEGRILETAYNEAEVADIAESMLTSSDLAPNNKKKTGLRDFFAAIKRMSTKKHGQDIDQSSSFGMKPPMLPIIGSLPARTQYTAGGALVVAALLGAAASGGYGVSSVGDANQRAAVASTVQMLSQKLASASESAIQGNSE